MCPPRVEEFCFITDNTYTKEEVLYLVARLESFIFFLYCAVFVMIDIYNTWLYLTGTENGERSAECDSFSVICSHNQNISEVCM